jgi:RNA polymerase sigma-70 factor (ECF subfamily)
VGPCPHPPQGDPLTDRRGDGDRLGDLARTGDRGAFEELVRATSSDIYALALRLTGNEHDARDIVQETYLRAFRSIRRFRGESSVSTWLYRIAANCSATLHHRRRGATVVSLDADHRAGELPSDHRADAIGSATVERDRLVRAIGTLPLTLRSVVVLHDVYDLGHDEIAAELGISSASSRVRLHRARRQLRAALPPETGGVALVASPGDRSGPAARWAPVTPLPLGGTTGDDGTDGETSAVDARAV